MGFRKTGPCWPVGAGRTGCRAGRKLSGRGSAPAGTFPRDERLAGNFSSAFWWQNDVFHSECKWCAASNRPYWESNEENAALPVKAGRGLPRGSPLALGAICCLPEARQCVWGATVSPGHGGRWHHGTDPFPLPPAPRPAVEDGVTSTADFRNISLAERGLVVLFLFF